jgi:hypothetical protein
MEPDNAVPLKPETPQSEEVNYIEQALGVIHQWRRILNARMLLLLALLGAMGVFGYAILDPTPLKIWVATVYALGVLWPFVGLFYKKG